jgi:putative ABC transport system permease protein
VKLVAREAGVLLAIGLVVGSVLAFAAAQTATSFLYGLKATDPVAIGGAIAALALVAVLASILPAARAAQIQPMTALRED